MSYAMKKLIFDILLLLLLLQIKNVRFMKQQVAVSALHFAQDIFCCF